MDAARGTGTAVAELAEIVESLEGSIGKFGVLGEIFHELVAMRRQVVEQPVRVGRARAIWTELGNASSVTPPVRSLKPNKEIFEFALQLAKANIKDSIMIGDNIEADIKGAMSAGFDTVFVDHLRLGTDVKPTYTIHHLKELEDIL